MLNKTKFTEELKQFENLKGNDEVILKKLDELLLLLEKSDLNSANISEIKGKLDKTLEKKLIIDSQFNEVKDIALAKLDKMDQLDKLEFLLNNNHFDSSDARRLNLKSVINRIIKGVIGLLFVTLGFAMIIMPAPPYFEMFTIYYFNVNDGVTLMDLISLIIVAVGIYIMINALLNLKSNE